MLWCWSLYLGEAINEMGSEKMATEGCPLRDEDRADPFDKVGKEEEGHQSRRGLVHRQPCLCYQQLVVRHTQRESPGRSWICRRSLRRRVTTEWQGYVFQP